MAAERSRRSTAGQRAWDHDVIERLKEIRSGAKRRAEQVKLDDNDDIYEELNEADYQELVKRRRVELADFVEDDGEGGYMDDGEEYWEEDEDGKKKSISRVNLPSRSRRGGAALPSDSHVASIFLGGRQYKPGDRMANVNVNAEDDDYLKDLLEQNMEEEEAAASEARTKAQLEKLVMFGAANDVQNELNSKFYSTPYFNESGAIVQNNNNVNGILFGGGKQLSGGAVGKKKGKKGGPDFSRPVARLDFDAEGNLIELGGGDTLIEDAREEHGSFGIDGALAMVPDAADPTFTQKAAKVSNARRLPPSLKDLADPSAPQLNAVDWQAAAKSVNPVPKGATIASTPTPGVEGTNPIYEVKVGEQVYDEITMFWYDCTELNNELYLFGKLLMSDKKSTASCCVHVGGLERNLYVLPRALALSDPDDEQSITDQAVSMAEVHGEVKQLLSEAGINKFKSKMVKRDYAFDRDMPDLESLHLGNKSSLLDPEDGVPRQDGQYLKVVYSFQHAALSRSTTGRTFSRIFGTKTTALELFLLKRKLMGPCWITIKNIQPVDATRSVSWCKFQYQIDSHKNIAVMENCPDPPLFSVMSLSLKTILNEQTHRHEIVLASYLHHQSVSVEGPTANEADVVNCTIIANLPKECASANSMNPAPIDFEVKARAFNQEKSKTNKNAKPSNKLEVMPNERALLSLLLAKIHTLDPDIIVGHDLHGFQMDVLLNRMGKNNIGVNWSKIGRLKKTKMPVSTGKGDDSFSLVDRGAGVGRLMLDTLVSAKEFIMGQKMYSLSYLAETQLQMKFSEVEATSVPEFYKTSDQLFDLIKRNENESYLQLALMFKVVMLPLTKQLTCLCGNMWSRSLRAVRSERVEYLLLHDFYRSKFIIPEKYTAKERKEREEQREEEERKKLGPDAKKRAAKNKPQYAGGKVLEPKRGFYDKIVLLLDFNSLYPSIIQEFNICFTTIKHWTVTKPGEMASPPPAGSETGHLPKVIKRLVERRRNVKAMAKKETNPVKQQELDIRQKALKLVANSTYGCLGFINSRFYSEPLAALITSQGREILQSSVDLTETLGANVIYGDTDSIMVYSNEQNIDKAIELGKKIKQAINQRHKVLEIDIDGLFKNMLLLRKKKYAALKIVEQPDGTRITQREVKGLDMVRRDWCPLSKDVSNYVLSQILSGAAREEVVENIHAFLMKMRDDVQNNRVALEKYIITKGLTKNPKEYTDAKNMPHVKVALDLIAKGQIKKQGDFIGYVICEGDAGLAQRAYDPLTVQQANGGLPIDLKWYLANQVLPPVARLCGPIEETDPGKIANCLGLDPKQFHNFGSKEERANHDEDDEVVAAIHQDDEERFKGATPLLVECPHCKSSYEFPGVFYNPSEKKENDEKKLDLSVPNAPSVMAAESGLQCHGDNNQCKGMYVTPADETAIVTQFESKLSLSLRQTIFSYYTSYFKCNDSSCGKRTRDISIKGNHCFMSGCKGRVEREFSAERCYLQLQYFTSLFDVERAMTNINNENLRRKVDGFRTLPQITAVLPPAHTRVYSQLHQFMMGVLQQSAYYWLSPSIFDVKIGSTVADKEKKKEMKLLAV